MVLSLGCPTSLRLAEPITTLLLPEPITTLLLLAKDSTLRHKRVARAGRTRGPHVAVVVVVVVSVVAAEMCGRWRGSVLLQLGAAAV